MSRSKYWYQPLYWPPGGWSKRETDQTYAELGRETFRLIEARELSHPALDPIADRVRATEAKAAAAGGGDPTPEPAEPPPPAAPPAMPS